jgi:hypothetical protein
MASLKLMGRPKLPGRRDENNKITPEYAAWQQMHQRCYNENGVGYEDYGGRGIKVAEEFFSFDKFLSHIGKRPGPGLSLNRIENDGDYAPGNVEWADYVTQNRNTRANRIISGQVLTAHAENLDTSPSTVRQRIDVLGWSEKLAISKPKREWKHRLLTHDGITLTLEEWAARIKMNAGTLRGRIRTGWSDEAALTTPTSAMCGKRRRQSGVGKQGVDGSGQQFPGGCIKH